MRKTIEDFLNETKQLSDDTVLGEVVGTDFYWKYGFTFPSRFGKSILIRNVKLL